MSGHSKWSQIKRQKASNDQQRSGVFSKMSRLITMAVHEGGGISDPEKNFRLRLVIERAKQSNMPKDTIQRAIDKAVGGEDAHIKEVVYEGFGPSGSCLLISVTTDNSNRTHAEIKHILEKNGGKMGSHNSVLHLFQKCAVAVFDKTSADEQAVFNFAESTGALDIDDQADGYTVYIPFENLGKVKGIEGIQPRELDIFYRPSLPVKLEKNDENKLMQLISKLDDLDDVQNIYTNIE